MQFRAARVASITVQGYEKTRDFVIEREIEMKVGDPLNLKIVADDLRRLSHLRLFRDESLAPSFAPREDNPLLVDVVYHVEERETGSIGFGVTYSTVEKLVAWVELADENLFGRAQYGALRWEGGGSKSSYELEFDDPNVLGTRTTVGFGLHNRTFRSDDEHSEYKEEHSVGGTVSVGKRFTEFLQGTVRLRVDDASIIPRDPSAPISENRTRSVQITLSGDTTDRAFYPTTGIRYHGSTEVALKILGGDTAYAKYEGSWSIYRKVGGNGQVVALRLMGGFSADELPYQDRFRVGGPDTVRAYNYASARGEKMIVGNAEYRFRISDGVQGVLFADAGNAWRAAENVHLSDLMTSVGVGIRVDTGFGTLRLDYGYGSNGGKWSFSIGPTF